MRPTGYVGRFAPSPSGPLHFGSLVAAVGSYLQAKTSNGLWLLRIEDLDGPRVQPGAADGLIRTLAAFGFQWDRSIEYQSARIELYRDALSDLKKRKLAFACSCSRAQIAATDEQRYPGTCRLTAPRPGEPTAERFRVEPVLVEFTDRIQGLFSQDVAMECGDFVIRRRDGIFAYHLAVVVDDAEQGITEVVRGADLLDSTPRHILLQRALKVRTPDYAHVALAVDSSGLKLSKSAQSLAIGETGSSGTLWAALQFLRQSPPAELKSAALGDLWNWAHAHWSLKPLQRVKSDSAPPPA